MLRRLCGMGADMLLDDDPSLLDDLGLGGDVGLPLPDVASPHWLGGMGPSNSDPGPVAGEDKRSGMGSNLVLSTSYVLRIRPFMGLEVVIRVLSELSHNRSDTVNEVIFHLVCLTWLWLDRSPDIPLSACTRTPSSTCCYAGSSSSSGESDRAAEEAQSSGDEWTARRRSRASAAQRAKQQQLRKLRAAKAAREKHKRRAAEAALRLAMSEGTEIACCLPHGSDDASMANLPRAIETPQMVPSAVCASAE